MSNVWFDLTWIRRYFVTLSPLKLENSNSCKFWWSLQVTKIRFKSKRKRKLEKLREIHLPNNLFRWKQITYLSLFSNYSFCVLLKNVLFKCSKIKKNLIYKVFCSIFERCYQSGNSHLFNQGHDCCYNSYFDWCVLHGILYLGFCEI